MGCKALFKAASAILLFTLAVCFPAADSMARPGFPPEDPIKKETIESDSFFLDEPERKDPFVAGLLSWSWTGLGQFYTQNYARGSMFLMTDLIQKGLLVYGVFYYTDKYNSDENDIVKWDEISKRDRGIIIGYVFSILLVKVLSVLDAVHSADTYNREIYFPYWKNRTRMRLSIEANDDYINVSMSKPIEF